jgi:DNA polymerase III subunit epsilon
MTRPDPLSDIRFSLVSVKTINDAISNTEVVEVACVRVHNGHMADRFHQFINPGLPLPEEFTRRTGIYPATLENQPNLEMVLPELASFIGRDVIIWTHSPQKTHAIHRHFRLTQPPERQLFLQSIAEKALPQLPKHTLSALAHHFQLDNNPWLRAESTAQASAEIFLQLLHLLRTQHQIHTFSELLTLCPAPKVRQHRTRNDLAFDREKLKTYPTQPGVYFMKNRLGEILYIGKAKNLRNRLRSYFQKQSRLPSKIAAMMKQVAMIDVTVVGSELEALLLESRLIKQHQPFFNKKIKDYQRMIFMQVSVNDPYPRISTAFETDNPAAAYFGPFSGKSVLRYKMEILNRVFQLRDCNDRKFEEHRNAPCMQFQLGLCSGPCAGRIDQTEYRHSVEDFLHYLEQKPSAAIEALISRRDAYVEELKFEKAAAIQEQLDLLERLQLKNYDLLQAIEEHHCLLVLPDVSPERVRILTVLHGQPLEWHTLHPKQDDAEILEHLIDTALTQLETTSLQKGNRSLAHIAKSLYEEARLISQWLATRTDDDGFVVYFKHKSRRQIFNELQLILHAHATESSLPEEALVSDFGTDTWDWEQALENG